MTPREAEAVKNASVSREKTDINNIEFDDVDIPQLPDLPSLLGFLSRGEIFDPEYTDRGENPFQRDW